MDKLLQQAARARDEVAEDAGRGESGACAVSASSPERVECGRSLMLDDATYGELAETFRALSDTSRAKIVYSLLWQELCTCDLAAITGSSESGVSQHLRGLKQLRLVKSRREGKMVFYSLDDAHIRILLSVCLSHVRDAGRQPEQLPDIDRVLGLMAHAAAKGNTKTKTTVNEGSTS